MAFTKCPVCGKVNQDKVKRCPYCGYPFIYYLIVIGLLALGTFIYVSQDKPREKREHVATEYDRYIEEDFFRSMSNHLLMGCEFNNDLVNSLRGLERYLSEPEKAALNLGVYAMDLHYLASYHKTQESLEYYHACGRLFDQLAITVGFGTQPALSIDPGSRDSLSIILDRGMEHMFDCKHISKATSCALMITSRAIEGLYLTTAMIETCSKRSDSYPILAARGSNVLEQGSLMPALLERLRKADQTPKVMSLIRDMEELVDEFASLDDLREELIRGDREVTLTSETFSCVTEKVKQIRRSIVN